VLPRRQYRRKWRLRGQRGQVAAVATILGLLLVVVYIANYLTTTLPGQMSTNDLNHVIQVENQLGRFQALLEAASAAHAVGAELTAPVTLGSEGQPPFASADSGTIAGEANGSYFRVNSTLSGPLVFTAPTGGTTGTGYDVPAGGCTVSGTGALCSGTNHFQWNFTGAAVNFGFTTTAGYYLINVTDSGASSAAPATITVTASGSAPLDLLVIGSNDSIGITIPVTATFVNLFVYGNYDTATVSLTGAGATDHVRLYEAGVHDTTTLVKSAGLTFLASIWGGTDKVVGPATANSSATTKVSVYYSGFNPGAEACPVDSIANSDTVSGSSTAGTYTANWNLTAPFTPAAVADWTFTTLVLAPIAAGCPFMLPSSIPFNLAVASAGLDVHLINTYIPSGDVVFDQGAIVYAQDGGLPAMVDTPTLSATENGYNFTSASMWFPVFTSSLPTEAGLSTTSLAARLISVNTISLTAASTLGIQNLTNIVVTIHSPFTAAWVSYFDQVPEFTNHWVCLPSGSSQCIGPYTNNEPMGTVVLTIPTGFQFYDLSIQVATFSVSLV
jgi:hypothetical protein